MQKSSKLYHKMQSKSIQCPADCNEEHEQAKEDGLAGCADEEAPLPTSVKPREHEHEEEEEHQMVSNFTAQSTASSAAMHGHGGVLGETNSPELQEAPLLSCESEVADKGFWTKPKDAIHQFIKELMAPPTIFFIKLFSGTVPIIWTISLDANLHSPLTQVLDVISRKPEITKISFLAHSVGGLAARYAIARLYRHPDSASDGNTKGTICGLVGINFITVAMPHLGSRGNKQVQLLTASFQWSVWVICLFSINMMHGNIMIYVAGLLYLLCS
jgi:hypothetical protein